MISQVARGRPVTLTPDDFDIFCALMTPARAWELRAADRHDAELMYMLTDEGPGAARVLMGLTSGEAKETSRPQGPQAHRGSGL